jgi:hypothetical protein
MILQRGLSKCGADLPVGCGVGLPARALRSELQPTRFIRPWVGPMVPFSDQPNVAQKERS